MSAPNAPHGIGWAELALAVGGLAIGTGEFASMSILPLVADALGASVPKMSHMISSYALGVVVGAPLITIVFARTPRRLMLIALMLMFALGNLLSAVAPNYAIAVIARFIAGVPHGAYFGLASLVAASLVPTDQRARAVSRVMLGLTVANVVGVPLATWFGQSLGWRAAFFTVGALALLAAIMVRFFLPEISTGNASPSRELGVFRKPLVWLTLGMVAVGFGGFFSLYTYITPTLTQITGLSASLVPLELCVIGIGMSIGTLVGGWFADRSRVLTIAGILLWNILTLSIFSLFLTNVFVTTLLLFLIGGGIAVGPAVQTRLMDVAGDAQAVAAALNHSAFNIANALGAWLGGIAIVFGYGLQATGFIGALLAAAGLVMLVISVVVEQGAAKIEACDTLVLEEL